MRKLDQRQVYNHRQCVSAHLVEGDIVEVCYDPNDTLRKEHGHDVVVVLHQRETALHSHPARHTHAPTFMWRLQKMMSSISVSASSCGGVSILVSAKNLILAEREGEEVSLHDHTGWRSIYEHILYTQLLEAVTLCTCTYMYTTTKYSTCMYVADLVIWVPP